MARDGRASLDPATQASVDQWNAALDELIKRIADHWEGPCPGERVCLGQVATEIGIGAHTSPASVGMALQAALSRLATIEYDRRHPDDTH